MLIIYTDPAGTAGELLHKNLISTDFIAIYSDLSETAIIERSGTQEQFSINYELYKARYNYTGTEEEQRAQIKEQFIDGVLSATEILGFLVESDPDPAP